MSDFLNRDMISSRTKINRKKAIEIILFGGETKNKTIKKMVLFLQKQMMKLNVA